MKAWFRHLLTLGQRKRNDVLVPWKASEITFARYYHLFSRSEITSLVREAGFVVDDFHYVGKSGNLQQDAFTSRNSLIVGEKKILRK